MNLLVCEFIIVTSKFTKQFKCIWIQINEFIVKVLKSQIRSHSFKSPKWLMIRASWILWIVFSEFTNCASRHWLVSSLGYSLAASSEFLYGSHAGQSVEPVFTDSSALPFMSFCDVGSTGCHHPWLLTGSHGGCYVSIWQVLILINMK